MAFQLIKMCVEKKIEAQCQLLCQLFVHFKLLFYGQYLLIDMTKKFF